MALWGTPKHIKLSEGQGVPLATPQPFPLHPRLPTASSGFPPLENHPRQRAFLSLATLSAAVPLHPCHTERKTGRADRPAFLLFRVPQRSKITFGNFQDRCVGYAVLPSELGLVALRIGAELRPDLCDLLRSQLFGSAAFRAGTDHGVPVWLELKVNIAFSVAVPAALPDLLYIELRNAGSKFQKHLVCRFRRRSQADLKHTLLHFWFITIYYLVYK